MAAVKNNHSKHNQACRDKIRTTQLINRLEGHALGEIELTPTQVQSINILLKKTLGDLSTVTHEGGDTPIDHTLTVKFDE